MLPTFSKMVVTNATGFLKKALSNNSPSKKDVATEAGASAGEHQTLFESFTSVADAGLLDSQSQSSLFSIIPPEIRTEIFALALTDSYDYDRPHSTEWYVYRPGHRYYSKVHTALLETCRAVYLETHLIPVRQAEHAFFYFRGPEISTLGNEAIRYFSRMTNEQKAAVKSVHIFPQLYSLNDGSTGFEQISTIEGLSVPRIDFTIRHSDWWFWENDDDPTSLRNPTGHKWGRVIQQRFKGLKEITLELESTEVKKPKLLQQAKIAAGWTFTTPEGLILKADLTEMVSGTWMGSGSFKPRNEPYPNHPDEPPPMRQTYRHGRGRRTGRGQLSASVYDMISRVKPALPKPPLDLPMVWYKLYYRARDDAGDKDFAMDPKKYEKHIEELAEKFEGKKKEDDDTV
jgi:hypothetical protein